MWRPEDWNNPFLPKNGSPPHPMWRYEANAFELGADAMLEAKEAQQAEEDRLDAWWHQFPFEGKQIVKEVFEQYVEIWHREVSQEEVRCSSADNA